MKKILVIAIVCLLGSFAAAAQTVKVNGTIVDEQNRPVEFVNVALFPCPTLHSLRKAPLMAKVNLL